MRGWAAAVLAAEPEQAEAGPTALLVVVLLAIGIAFLARSMVKHLRRVPPSFDPPPDNPPPYDPPLEGRGTPPVS